MPESSHACFSTIWKLASAGLKPIQIRSETRKVMIVANSAIRRMFFSAAWLSSRMNRMRTTPTSGRKVTVVRMGQSVMSKRTPEHHPGDERDDADQHHECVVVEIAGLQLDDAVGDVDHPC